MVVSIINSYLKSNRRLVVPSFGAFLAKEDGQIVFSELLKRDDGVLRELIMSQGKSEIEAAAAIDRFIFEVRHDLQQAGVSLVAELGTFHRSEEGVIVFEAVKPVMEESVAAEEVITPQPAASAPQPIQITPPTTPLPPRPAPRHKPQPRRSGSFIMWFAGIVIAGALIALAYGLYCMWTAPDSDLDAQMDAQRIPMIEIPATTNSIE